MSAAERLRDWVRVNAPEIQVSFDGWLDAALAAERKATVENIRAMVLADSVFSPSLAEARVRLDAILDAEAARGGLLPTDLTTETSSERGRRDALRHEAGE